MPDPLVLSNGVQRVHIVTFGRQVQPRKRLDVSGGKPDDGTPIIQWDATDGANQRFLVIPAGDQAVLIVTFSGRVLDIEYNGGAGARVWAWEANYGPAQRWLLEPAPGGAFVVANAARPELVLDIGGADQSAGAPLCVWHRNGQPNQSFFFEETS